MPDEALPIRDIHLPSDISWWPPAPGWWIVLAAVLLITGIGFFVYYKKHRNRLRDAGLSELGQIWLNYQQQQDDKEFIQALSILLRRICLSRYPRVDVAGLTGEAWLEFLDKGLEQSIQNGFSQGAGRSLISAPYQREIEINSEALHSLCRDWLMTLASNKGRRVHAA